jgi:hypothetical protein
MAVLGIGLQQEASIRYAHAGQSLARPGELFHVANSTTYLTTGKPDLNWIAGGLYVE